MVPTWGSSMSRLICLLFLALLITAGCSARKPPIPQPPAKTASDAEIMADNAEVTDLETARKVAADLMTRAKAAETRVEELEKIAQAERMQKMITTCWWVAGICFFGALICIAAAVFVETMRKLLITGAGVGFGLMFTSIIISYMLPHLATAAPFIMIGIGVIALGGAVWWFWRMARVKAELSHTGVEALHRLNAISTNEAEDIKEKALKRQVEKGLHDEIGTLVKRVKKKNGFVVIDPDLPLPLSTPG